MSLKSTITNFELRTRKNGQLAVYYRKTLFLVISEKVLLKMILDIAPSGFLKSLVELSGVSEKKVDNNLILFSKIYTYEYLKFYRTKSVRGINDVSVMKQAEKFLKDRKIARNFSDTLSLMKENGIEDLHDFIQSQVAGLKFIDNGGVFPKPSQLCSANAIPRYLEYISKNSVKNEKSDKPKNYWYFKENVDGQIGLNNNTKYQEALKKIKNRTASLECAIYAQRCYAARRDGDSLGLIEEYISTISN
jgi:hypothetical protein